MRVSIGVRTVVSANRMPIRPTATGGLASYGVRSVQCRSGTISGPSDGLE
jgi:hypothetical protein